MPERIVPIKVYAKVHAALPALNDITCAVSFIDIGKTNAVGMVIAFVKASPVALIFMRLRYRRRLMRGRVAAGLFWPGSLLPARSCGDGEDVCLMSFSRTGCGIVPTECETQR